MIGSGLKKLANENNMYISNGVAYGSLQGYAATMSEGSGYKLITFSVKFPEGEKKAALTDYISAMGNQALYKSYRVNNLGVAPAAIQVVFHDTVGTMKKIREFIAWFIPLLREHGATTANICAECGQEVTEDCWIMVDNICHHVHPTCAAHVEQSVASANEQAKEEREGSYLMGTIGAFLGAAVGAVVWAFILYLGYVASIVGLLIGWLAEKGYTLLKGRQAKAKVVILIFAIIFGVVLGTFAVDFVVVAQMINAGELEGVVMADIPLIISLTMAENADYRNSILSNIGLGLLFAALGVFALLRKAGKEVADTKYKRLR